MTEKNYNKDGRETNIVMGYLEGNRDMAQQIQWSWCHHQIQSLQTGHSKKKDVDPGK